MNNGKKAAEAKSKFDSTRDRQHVIAGLADFCHLGINSDIYRINRSGGVHRTCVFGYFFIGHESEIKKITSKQDIIDNWEHCRLNDYGYTSLGLGKSCYAIYNRNKNILVVDKYRADEWWYLKRAVNKDCKVVEVDNVNDYNIINKPKQLAIAELKVLIRCYQQDYNDVYRIINDKAIVCHSKHFYNKYHLKLRARIIDLADEFKSIPRDKPLDKTTFDYNVSSWGTDNRMSIDMLTINQIINFTEFTKEQRKLYRQRRWWSSFGYGHGISFKDTQAKWNTKVEGVNWQKYVEHEQGESLKAFNDRVGKLRKGIEVKRKKLMADIFNIPIDERLKRWREESNVYGYDKLSIVYDDFRVRGRNVEWFKCKEFVSLNCFENKQLKLSKDGKEVITSACARVTLVHALMLFNRLYLKYIVPQLANWVNAYTTDYKRDFTNEGISIGYYKLRSLGYCEKVTDYNRVHKGYKEWYVEIGCHTLWFDDVKEFCRYYHLEDKVKFDCAEVKR